MYQYKVRFLPTNISVKRGNLAKVMPAVEQFLTLECAGGWEYYRSDMLNVVEQPGCLGSIFGGTATVIPVVLFVFRRESDEAAMNNETVEQMVVDHLNGKKEIAYYENSGKRLGEVTSKDHQYAYVVKADGSKDKFLLEHLRFEYE